MRRRREPDKPEIPIAPMIDCVFLMLVYFMTTSSLERSEADLDFPAGAAGTSADPLTAIDEQVLVIDGEGTVQWNGSLFPLLDGNGPQELQRRLASFQQTCVQAGSDPSLRLEPDPKSPHQAIVSCLDAAGRAGIETIHFP